MSEAAVGIIAGGGGLPEYAARTCERRGIKPFIVAFTGHTDPALTRGRAHIWTRLAAVGEILQALRDHEIRDLTFIGSIRRPALSELRPDLTGAMLMARLGLRSLGDDGILRFLADFLKEEGFSLKGVQHYLPEILSAEGLTGKTAPGKQARLDIARGIDILSHTGPLDIGQAVVVQQGLVLGLEAAEGTDRLISRCGEIKRRGKGPVLVKLCKPGQSHDFDLPTIGVDTVENCARAGFSGIAIHAGASLMIDKEKVAQAADRHKLFVIGITPETFARDL